MAEAIPVLDKTQWKTRLLLSACLPEDGITSSHDPGPFPCKDRNLAASLSERDMGEQVTNFTAGNLGAQAIP